MTLSPSRSRSRSASLPRPFLFWSGLAMTTAGVLLHLPAYFAMRTMDRQMAGMAMGAAPPMNMGSSPTMNMGSSPTMVTGMILLTVGLVISVAGLIERRPTAPVTDRYQLLPPSQDRLSPAHARLIAALSLAMIIDIMKPATLAFILPGMRSDYHISVATSATLPVVALTGTVFGSLLWGYLGDRIGRRATILMSSIIFVATTVCAVMPTFTWNLVMCFLMGAAAGGLLPVSYALMAESIPTKHRSFVMVLQAGLATVLAYFMTSGLAALLIPHFGWRIMWFTHLPFAVLILVLHHWIPESPRFLLQHGRTAEALEVAERFGMRLAPADTPGTDSPTRPSQAAGPKASRAGVLASLFERGTAAKTVIVGLYALSWGAINWGFMTFLPSLLKSDSHLGVTSNTLLFYSSLIAIPGTGLVAVFYARWSSRKTMALFGALSALALGVLAVIGLSGSQGLTIVVMGVLITGTSGVIAMLSPYTAEVYPTRVRSAGSGFAAACSKAGGVFGPPLLALLLAHHPGVSAIALVCAAPMAVATVLIGLRGQETGGQDLDHLDADPAQARPEELVLH